MKKLILKSPVAALSRHFCLEAENLSETEVQNIRSKFFCHEGYITPMEPLWVSYWKTSHPFLQGYKENGENSWVLIEFWSDNQDFILEASIGFASSVNMDLEIE